MKKLLAAALFIVLASPAFAAIQNVKVSGTVTSYFVDRNDFDFKTKDATAYNQNFFYTSTHVLISSDLSDNVSAQVGLANEVAWGDQNSGNSASGGGVSSNNNDQRIDLELANVTLKEFLYSPLTITIGRQTLSYGNDFIIGAGGGGSVGTMANIANDMSRTQNYDGIRAVLDYKPLTVDLVYVKTNAHQLESGVTTGVGKDDTDLYGGVANYQLGDPMNSVVEGSFWARIDNSTNTNGSATFRPKVGSLYVPDLRVSTNPLKDLTLSAEGAVQLGTNVTATRDQSRRAFGLQGKASYSLPVMEKYKPTVAGTYTYVSGDNGKKNREYRTWDPMFNDQNLGTRIWRSLFNYSDLQLVEGSFSVNPLEDVTAKVTWTDLWFAQNPGPGGITETLPDGNTRTLITTDNKSLGNEFDGELTYQYTEDVSFGLNLGIFVPGDALHGLNNGVAKEAIASVGVNF